MFVVVCDWGMVGGCRYYPSLTNASLMNDFILLMYFDTGYL